MTTKKIVNNFVIFSTTILILFVQTIDPHEVGNFDIKQCSMEQYLKKRILQAEDGCAKSMEITQNEIEVGKYS